MNGKLKLIFIIFGILTIIALFTLRLEGQTLEILPARALVVEVTNLPSVDSKPIPIRTFLDKIMEAKNLIASPSLELKVGKRDIVYYEKRYSRNDNGAITLTTSKRMTDPEREIALVLLDLYSGDLELIKITEKGNELTFPDGYEIANVERPNGITNNDWNTCRRVIKPASRAIILNVWPHYVTKKVANPVKDKRGRVKVLYQNKEVVENVVYSPYCDPIHITEFIENGKKYRKSIPPRALEILKQRAVPSRTFPDKLLADVITEGKYLRLEYFERLPLIEHMDYGEFIIDARKSAERVDVILGTNTDQAYNLTCSRKKACGWLQYTRNTWNAMRSKYRSAELPVFESGVKDHVMSMVAAMLLDDNNLKAGADKFGLEAFEDSNWGEEMLDANYNGGTVRPYKAYRASILQSLEDWLINPMRTETKQYIKKLRYVREEYN